MMKNKIRILHVAQAAGGVDRYIRMLLKYLDKEKFENILVCSQDFHEEDYRDLVDSFEQVEMTRAIGSSDLKAIKEVRALIKKYNPDISNRILTLSQPYLKSTKFHYLRNPIDLSDQMVMDHHCSNIYLCAGRVSEEKGVEDFCKAITEVQKSADIRGQVVGIGPLLDTLKLKYPKIEFVGWVNSTQLTKYYQAARSLVFPSICNEGSPLTIPEALSAGLPCIVTDCTSATETITDGINGLIYDTGNVEALKQKIQISLEDTVIDRFQKNIRDSFKCADYSYATYVVQVNRLYDSILMEEQER